MIQPKEVIPFLIFPKPSYPPGVVLFLEGIPPKNGHSPALAIGIEIVGGHTGYVGHGPFVIELEQVRMGPHIHRIVVHVKGQIAKQLNTQPIAVGFQGFPLRIEHKLLPLCLADGVLLPAPEGGQCVGLAELVRIGPLVPGLVVVRLFQHGIQGKIVQPVGFLLAELAKSLFLTGRQVLLSPLPGFSQQRLF